jgi:hypothetical protein
MLKPRKTSVAGVFAGTLALLASAAPANAEEAQPQTQPQPTTFAEPAMSGLDVLVVHAGALYMPRFPSIGLSGAAGNSGNVQTPVDGEGLASFGVSEYLGGGLGLHPTLSLGIDFGMGVAGTSTGSFSNGGHTYANQDSFWWGARLPSPGLSWHKTGYVVGAQIVPELAWMSGQAHDETGARLAGNTFVFMASLDLQACREYNLFGFSSKNSAVCLYAAPVIYAGDFFNGASFGVRSFMF